MPENLMNLSGRVAVVIGGTSGLGRALTRGLANAGADVVPTSRRANMVEEACGELEAQGRRTLRATCDVSRRESIDALRDRTLAEFGRVDILVNAAQSFFRKTALEVEEDEWNQLFDVNLTGVLRACQSFFLPLARSGRGRIVNLASLNSFVSLAQVAAYAASKAGVAALTRSLAVEWAHDGIKVNAIAPGVIRSEENAAQLDGTERGRELRIRTPMGRFGQAEELVGLTVLLASGAASFITGQCIAVDGGFLASGVNQ